MVGKNAAVDFSLNRADSVFTQLFRKAAGLLSGRMIGDRHLNNE
jgi:hypothetical protein